MMHTFTKKAILYSAIAFFAIAGLKGYNTEPALTNAVQTESFEILTEAQQLIRVDVLHQCGEWIHFALDETVVPETERYVQEELDIIADVIILFTDEETQDDCRINELDLTLIGVGM